MTGEEAQSSMKPGEWKLEVNTDLTSGCRYTMYLKGDPFVQILHQDRIRKLNNELCDLCTVIRQDFTDVRQAFTASLKGYVNMVNETQYFTLPLIIGPLEMVVYRTVNMNGTITLQYTVRIQTGRLYGSISRCTSTTIWENKGIDFEKFENSIYKLLQDLFTEFNLYRDRSLRMLRSIDWLETNDKINRNCIVGNRGSSRRLTEQEIRDKMRSLIACVENKQNEDKEAS